MEERIELKNEWVIALLDNACSCSFVSGEIIAGNLNGDWGFFSENTDVSDCEFKINPKYVDIGDVEAEIQNDINSYKSFRDDIEGCLERFDETIAEAFCSTDKKFIFYEYDEGNVTITDLKLAICYYMYQYDMYDDMFIYEMIESLFYPYYTIERIGEAKKPFFALIKKEE